MADPGLSPPQGWGSWPANASQVRVTLGSRSFVAEPGQTVRIGRAPDNEVVVGNSSVSARHAQLSWAGGGWVYEGTGPAPTYLNSQPVTRVALSQPTELSLGAPDGPVVRLELVPRTSAAMQAPPGPPPGWQPPPAAGLPPGTQAPPGNQWWAGPQPPPGTQWGPGFQPPPGTQPPRGTQWGPGSQPPPGAHVPPGAQPGPGPQPTPGQQADAMKEALRILIPITSWLHNPSWRQGWRLLFIVYALLPLVFLILFQSSPSQSAPGWAYSLYIAPLWGFAFWYLIRPGPVTRLVAGVGAGIALWTVAWISAITGNIDGALNPAHFAEAIGVGLNEEITKALPVLLAGILLLKYRSAKLDVRMWMFLGTIAGLVFGVVEAAGYTALDLNTNAPGQAVLLAFAERVFVDGFQHAIWAGISAFFIGMGLNYPRRRMQLVILGVSMAALLHALNDWVLSALNSQVLWVAVQAFSLFLFLGYTISSTAIERAVQQTPMFRGGTGPQTFATPHGPGQYGPEQNAPTR